MAESNEHGESAGRDAFLRGYLAERDEPCPMCEYNLRRLTGAVCPECGEALRLRVSLSEPKMAAYLCGLIGLSMGVGFSGIVLVWVLIFFLFERYIGLSPSAISVLVFQLALEGAAMGFWLRKRRWVRRRSGIQQRALVATGWAASVGLVILFFWTLLP